MALRDLFTPRPTEPAPLTSLNEFVYGEGPPKEEGGFWKTLELLGRPQLAMGEAIGAATRGEDMLEAAKRGISGERKYGTLGEQVFKDDPELSAMEALARKAAAVGVDIATDPTWLVGLPAAGKVAGLAAKALPAARKIPGLRAAAKYVLPLTTQLRWFGGKAGDKIATLVSAAEDAKNLKVAQAQIELATTAKNLGVGTSKVLGNAAREHLESGAFRQGIVHADQRVQGFAGYLDDLFKRIGGEVEGLKDPAGEGFQIIEPVLRSIRTEVIAKTAKLGLTGSKKDLWTYVTTGAAPPKAPKKFQELANFTAKKLDDVGFARTPGSPSVFSKEFYQRPFKTDLDYFPRLATADYLKSLDTPEGFGKAVKAVAKMNNISEFEAEKILKNIGTPRKAGNIEYARTMNFPGYEKDPLQAVPRYLEQVVTRVEYAKRFGVKGQVLNKLLKEAMENKYAGFKGISKADAGLIRDVILGRSPAKTGLERIARGIMGYQVMTKMGPLSTLSNLSQSANTIIKEGGVNFLKGTLRGMTNEGSRQGAIAYAGGVHENLMRMMGATGKGAEWWLKYSGFTPVERLNRLLASNAGVVAAERLIRQSGGKIGPALLRRGITQGDLAVVQANNWKLPTELADKVGLIASNATQHVTGLKDIPVGWQSPGIRMMVQFKSFVYQQTRFLLREIVSPAIEFFNSNGKKGTVGPLTRAVATFGLGGGLIAHIRDQAKGIAAGLLKMEHDPREPVPDDWALRVLEDSLNMGGLGVAGDLVQRAARRDFKGWLLGPSVGDLSDMVEMFATGGAEMYKKGELDFARIGAEALRHVPFVSPIIPKRGLKGEVEKKLGGLGGLFYGR